MKRIWIKIYNSDEVENAQRFILSLGDEGLLGDIPVKLYIESTRGIRDLSHVYDVSEKALIPLYEKYGEMNVKIMEHTDSDIKEYEESSYMNEDQLTRIAEALEGINNNLSDIALSLDSLDQTLDGCISRNGNNSFICITGNVSTC